ISAILAVLWLVLRLKLAPFALSAAFALLLAVGTPLAIFFIAYGAAGMRQMGFAGGSTPAAQTNASARRSPSPASAQAARSSSPGPAQSPSPPADYPAEHRALEAKLKKIGEALSRFAQAHNGQYPYTLTELRNNRFIT